MNSKPEPVTEPPGSCSPVGPALDGMRLGMVMTNAAGRVTWMNRAAERALGVQRAQGLGLPLAQVLRDPELGEFWRRASAAEGTLVGEVSVRWPRAASLRCNATRCRDEGSACIGRALVLCDVTHEEVVELRRPAQASERPVALDEGTVGTRQPIEALTGQELRALRLVGDGLDNQAIARAMHVAPSTVRTHLKHVYAKLGLRSRSEAIRFALQSGLAGSASSGPPSASAQRSTAP